MDAVQKRQVRWDREDRYDRRLWVCCAEMDEDVMWICEARVGKTETEKVRNESGKGECHRRG